MGDIANILEFLDLSKYEKVFTEQEVTLDILHLINEQDLIAMGLTIGARKKVLQYINKLQNHDDIRLVERSPRSSNTPTIDPTSPTTQNTPTYDNNSLHITDTNSAPVTPTNKTPTPAAPSLTLVDDTPSNTNKELPATTTTNTEEKTTTTTTTMVITPTATTNNIDLDDHEIINTTVAMYNQQQQLQKQFVSVRLFEDYKESSYYKLKELKDNVDIIDTRLRTLEAALIRHFDFS